MKIFKNLTGVLLLLMVSLLCNGQDMNEIDPCVNAGFEDNNFSGWVGMYGTYQYESACTSTSCGGGLSCNECSVNQTVQNLDAPSSTQLTAKNPGCNKLTEATSLGNKFKIISDKTQKDIITNTVIIPEGTNHVVRLGNSSGGGNIDQLIKRFKVTPSSRYYLYRTKIILENGGHLHCQQPYFEVRMNKMVNGVVGEEITCARTLFVVDANNPKKGGFEPVPGRTSVFHRDWTYTMIDLSKFVPNGDEVQIRFTTADCAQVQHFGYAYIDTECSQNSIAVSGNELCPNKDLSFKSFASGRFPATEKLFWDFGDGSAIIEGANPSHKYTKAGTYKVKLTINTGVGTECNILNFEQDVAIGNCKPPVDCENCVSSFSPARGEKYLLSAWVKEWYKDVPPVTYKSSGIRLSFETDASGTKTLDLMQADGPIIDGWQRIEVPFEVPSDATNIKIDLVNTEAAGNVYFDDIRIHPFRSNMKSFVYDPSSQKLTAELDEQNYSTRYEYDDEGILIRVKKETERGVMTIKETRNNQSKITVK